MSDEKILREAMKNSKLRRFVRFDNEDINNNKNNSNTTKYDSEVKEVINKKFQELRKMHLNLNVDNEAEEYIQKLRDIGEYNRWSLKLIQKWLTTFYNGIQSINFQCYFINYLFRSIISNIKIGFGLI